MRDLGLDYEAAGHGIQSAIRFEMSKLGIADDQYSALIRFIKHMRVAIDMRAGDQQGLAALLIKKGVITTDEYTEAMRLGANEELASYEKRIRKTYGLLEGEMFR